MFPQKTYEIMLDIERQYGSSYDFGIKLRKINTLKDVDKKNRWFGYYQKVDEDLGLWTLQEVRDWVREENKLKKKNPFMIRETD